MYKLLSGRYLFTIIAALVFFNLSLSGFLEQDKVMEILLVVVYAYFNRLDRQQPKKGE